MPLRALLLLALALASLPQTFVPFRSGAPCGAGEGGGVCCRSACCVASGPRASCCDEPGQPAPGVPTFAPGCPCGGDHSPAAPGGRRLVLQLVVAPTPLRSPTARPGVAPAPCPAPPSRTPVPEPPPPRS